MWHPSQTLEEHEDGSLTITLRVGPTVEVKRWVLSFGATAEVLEPESLGREIAAEARKMADRDPELQRVAAGGEAGRAA